jgi:hypothetical protein
MKILFAPQNMASIPAITAAAMNRIEGVKAFYLSDYRHQYVAENKFRIGIGNPFEYTPFKKNPVKNIAYRAFYNLIFRPYRFLKLCRWIMWADVIHWTWDSIYPSGIDLWLVKFFKKKRFIEWIGSDIRVPEVTMKESPWYKEAYHNGYEYRNVENKEKSYRIQEKFAKYGFVPILVPEMQLFLKPGLFSIVYTTQYRAFEKEKQVVPYYPKLTNEKILIVHSPSAKMAKGSNYIIPIIEELKKQYPIEFILLHNVSRQQVLDTMKNCDIFIDQIVLGSFASAAIEALSYGKPVVAYIMPSVFEKGTPLDCPVVNANPDTLKEVLINLIENPGLRNKIGIESRKYVEYFHDTDKLVADLINIYNTTHSW